MFLLGVASFSPALAQAPATQTITLTDTQAAQLLIENNRLDDAKKVLHVMANFVTDHVGVRKLARRAKLLGHQVEEGQVEINDPVVRTIEGTGRRFALPASGRVAVAE